MSYNPTKFMQAVYDTLTGDGALMAAITGIYSYAPQETAAPYITAEIKEVKPYQASGLNAFEIEYELCCFSSESGFSELYDITEKTYNALQDSAASLSGYTVINTRFIESEYERLKDGIGTKATLSYRSVIQEN